MRGAIHHLDLTVRDPWASRPSYDAVLGYLGYRLSSEHERGIASIAPVDRDEAGFAQATRQMRAP